MENDIFDNFINSGNNKQPQPKQIKKEEEVAEFVDEETGQVEKAPINQKLYDNTKKVAQANPNQPVEKTTQLSINERMLARIDDLTKSTGDTFTGRDRVIATDIIIASFQQIRQAGYNVKQIDFLGNNIESQIKRWAKLGVGTQDNLYTELRKNGKTGMVDIKIKAQYQTLEKLIVKYCSMDIFKFKTDVICVGDEFETDFDFATGQDKVIKHVKNPNADPNDLDQIIGAYKIAYAKEKDGKVTQLLVQIDKNRIMRAYNSAQTKNVWNNDTKKMVLKTVTWEMWNSEVIRPFMIFPEDVIAHENLSIVNESADVEFLNKDLKHKDIIDAKTDVEKNVGTGDEVDF